MEPTPEEIAVWRRKAEKLDELAKKVDAFYVVDKEGDLIDKEAGSLVDIGRMVAQTFGHQ